VTIHNCDNFKAHHHHETDVST